MGILDIFRKGLTPLSIFLSSYDEDEKKETQEGAESKEQLSLDMDSTEYREYLFDKNGVDEKSQDKVVVGLRLIDPFEREKDNAQEILDMRNANYSREIDLNNLDNNSSAKKEIERRVQNQIKKDTRKRELELEAMRMAKRTETLEDDKKAKVIGDKSDDMVYDDEISPSEYVPKALRKYLK